MYTMKLLRRGLLVTIAASLLWTADAASQVTIQIGSRITPKLEPVAETKLLMEGLAHTNFKGIEQILSKKPADDQSWTFARGQALLLAETANLLMIRPPKKEGQPAWFERSMDLRKVATTLAQATGNKDFTASRTALVNTANSCNRCHQSFRVPIEIEPFAEKTQLP
jgi:hypothetical protein